MEVFMANNLLISYDLNSPGQNYEKVIEEIQSLGNWAKVQKSFWYVNSNLTASQAAERIWAKMDKNDSLFVVDSASNDAAWYGLLDKVGTFIKNHWRLWFLCPKTIKDGVVIILIEDKSRLLK